MRARVLTMCLALGVTSAIRPVHALDVKLTYWEVDAAARAYFPSGFGPVTTTFGVPAGDWKLPALNHKRPAHGLAQFADAERLLLFDAKSSSDDFYTRIYFDSNGNRDLTDDEPVDALRTTGGGRSAMMYGDYPPVTAQVTTGGVALPYSFTLLVRCRNLAAQVQSEDDGQPDIRHLRCYLRPNCAYRGSFRLAGERYHVLLGDTNVNGRFNDRLKIASTHPLATADFRPAYATGDALLISDSDAFTSNDSMVLGDQLLLDGQLYAVDVGLGEERLVLTPVADELSRLKLSMATERLVLHTTDGERSVMMFRPGREVEMMPGTYKLYSYQAVRKGRRRGRWELVARAGADTPTVTVGGEEPAELAFGEPFTPVTYVAGYYRERLAEAGGPARLSFTTQGQAAEVLVSAAHHARSLFRWARMSEGRPKPPMYRIVTAGGEKVGLGKFEYG